MLIPEWLTMLPLVAALSFGVYGGITVHRRHEATDQRLFDVFRGFLYCSMLTAVLGVIGLYL